MPNPLPHDEYVEQHYLFTALVERLPQNFPLQEVLAQLKDEVLASTKLPMALNYLLAELTHGGSMSPAMAKLGHYFAPFQTYLMKEAEQERGRFDIHTAVKILQAEAKYRSESPSPPGLFMFQLEALSRNRLSYDQGIKAISDDPLFDEKWRQWILLVRKQIGIVDLPDLIFLRSQHYFTLEKRKSMGDIEAAEEYLGAPLFGEKEGQIALANRNKDPLYLFAALQRHLGYPRVPRPTPAQKPEFDPRQMSRRIEHLETRIKILEDEQKGGFDLTQFYKKPD
jgi:hypothetical protein